VAQSGRPDIGGEEQSVDGTTWTRVEQGNTTGRLTQKNVLRETSGPTGHAKRNIVADSPASAWRLFVSEPILRLIKHCTELEARKILKDNSWSVSLEELDAFIAVLYARGAYGARTITLHDLWNKQWGPPFFSQTMSRNRFIEILRFLRFDEKATRHERKISDKFCLASELWNKFIENCIACYRPSENITVDEQLFPSKCRCPFTQYMSSKPDKYGVKYWLATDAKIRYILNGFPYLGKDETRPQNRSLGEHVVLRLLEPFLHKGRNVTTDNFFTSVSLANELQKRNTSIVGTLNKVRREVPPSLKNARDPLHSTVIYKMGDITLTSYQGKVKKNVIILSTMHSGVLVDQTAEKKTPDTVKYYNDTKCGVDVVDQMSRKYSVRAGTRRWPVHVFYNVLDLAMINAHALFKLVTNSKVSRRSFIFSVAEELAGPYVNSRSRITEIQTPVTVPNPSKRRQCQIGLCNKNKTKDICSKCKKLACGSCLTKYYNLP